MDSQNWTTRWENLREIMGTPSSRRRKNVEAFLQTRPCLMYWGDSWFSTPLYLNLAKQSMLRIDGMAMVVGKPGATASELFTGHRIKDITGRIKANPFDVLCLSAGGNDELSGRLEKMFAPWMRPRPPAKLSPRDAFAVVEQSKTLETVRLRYAALLDALGSVVSKRKSFRVVGHTYAPLQLIGQPADLTVGNIGLIAWVKDDVGPWLWSVMKRVLADKDEGKLFADLLLQQGFRDQVLRPLAAPGQFGSFFSFADFSNVPGAANAGFWNDEIHPTQDGFAELSRVLNAQIRGQLPSAKRGAVS